MKIEWTKLTDRIYCGSVLSSIIEPKWYKILNEMFAETHKNLAVSARADLLFPLNKESDLNTTLSEENEKKKQKQKQTKENTLNHHRSMQKKHRRKKKTSCCIE